MTIASERTVDCVGIRTNIVRIPEILSSPRKSCQEVKYVKLMWAQQQHLGGKFICMLTYLYPTVLFLPSGRDGWYVKTQSGDKGGSPQALITGV